MFNKQVLTDKFFTDPDWRHVEDMISSHIDSLLKMEDVDVTQSAETVKAEVIGRQLAHERLTNFLNETGIVTRKVQIKENPFK